MQFSESKPRTSEKLSTPFDQFGPGFTLRVLLALLVSNLVLVLFGGISLYRSSAVYHDRAAQETRRMASMAAQGTAARMDKLNVTLQVLSSELERDAAGAARYWSKSNADVSAHLASHPGLLGLTVQDAAGKPLVSAGLTVLQLQGQLAETQSLVTQLKNPNQVAVQLSPLISEGMLPGAYFYVGKKVVTKQGTFQGTVVAAVSNQYFLSLLSSADASLDGGIGLRDTEMRLILRLPMATTSPVGSTWAAADVKQIMRAAPNSGTFVSDQTSDGVERTLSYHRVPGYALYVWVTKPTDSYLQPWRRELRDTSLYCLVFLFASCAFAWFLLRMIDARERQFSNQLSDESRFRALMESASDAILVISHTGIVYSVNKRAELLLGEGSLCGKQVLTLLAARHTSRYGAMLNKFLCQSKVSPSGTRRSIVLYRTDGVKVPVSISISHVEADAGSNFVLDIRDISDTREAARKLELLATRDVLTDLPNRTSARKLGQALVTAAEKSGAQVAFVLLDLDGLKQVNDSVSYLVGDEVLRNHAKLMLQACQGKELVCRLGSDEFLWLIPEPGELASFDTKVSGLLRNLEMPVIAGGIQVKVSSTAGVSVFPRNGVSFDELLQRADSALQQAKCAGKNVIRFFDAHLNAELEQENNIAMALARATSTGNFSLRYQPIVDLVEGRIVSVEALIRWTDAELGPVSPGQFIPIAEKTGLITAIGEWVLEEACAQSARWTTQTGCNIPIAVNLSAVQFARSDIEHSVLSALSRNNVNARHLQLELTESVLIGDTPRVLEVVRRLRGLGIQVSLDDFGTGYSSLSYLKKFNADKVKIDQSFVRGLCTSGEDVAIVRAIIQMAHSLGMKVVAEGIETADVLQVLRDLGCDYGQGYLFDKPCMAESVPLRFMAGYSAHCPDANKGYPVAQTLELPVPATTNP